MVKMNFILFFVTFICFLSFQQVSAGCSSSDISKVNSCYNDYLKALGINNPSSDFNYYYQYVTKYYLSGFWNDVKNLCNKFGTLQYCINKDCMNVNDFKKVATFGGNSASDFIGNYYGLDYMCNDGNNRYYNSYICLRKNSQNINNQCSNYHGTDCTTRKNQNICVVNEANYYCYSEAKIYTNTSLFTILCHSKPECCNNGSNSIGLSMGSAFTLFVIQAVSKYFN